MAEIDKKEEKLPGDAYTQSIRARFWLTGQNSGYLGIGRVELLENIQKYGSMNRAAKEMGMSYKKAWKLVEELNRMSDRPLVVKTQGGKSGGGTSLTDEGQRMVAKFRHIEEGLKQYLEQVEKEF